MARYLIGIDNGSQSSKVTIFDERGRAVAAGTQALKPYATPAAGRVEHPDDDLWQSIATACRRALDAFDGDPADIVGAGLCTIRFCRAVLRADGSLAQPVMSWMDERVSRPYAAEVDDAASVTTSSGYIGHRLTGRRRDTAANYQGVWPIDTDTWAWSDDDRFAETGLRRDQLFELVAPGAIIGHVTAAASAETGLPEGLPIIATANDKAVEALGCGLRAPDTALVSLGTYIAGMAVTDRNLPGGDGYWTNFAAVDGEYLVESEGIRRGMWTVSWFRDLLGAEATQAARDAGLTAEDYLNAGAIDVPAGSDGLLTVLDWLAPADAPHKRGAFLGFDVRHGRFHLYRSILEAIALTMADNLRRLAAGLGHPFTGLVLSGGGSSSTLLAQIFADVTGLPVTRNRVRDAAGLGAALTAAVALGVHPTVDAALDAMVERRDTLHPDPARHDLYAGLADARRDVLRHTDAIFRRMAALDL